MTSRLSLGESLFVGGYRLEFRQKKEQVIAKLYDKEDEELGSCALKNLSIQPWTYETLPQLAKSKIEQFLNSHDVPLRPERVAPLHSKEINARMGNLSLVSPLPSFSSRSTSSTAIFPFPSPMPSVTLSSSSYQPSLEDLKHLLLQFGYPEQKMQVLIQSSSSDKQKLLLVDTLFEQVLSLSQIPSLDSSLLDIRDSQGYNLFLATVALGEETKYQAIFSYYKGKKELYAKDPQGRSALHIAASLGHHRLIPLLMDAGFNPLKKDNHGLVPLHWSIHTGNPDAVRAFIQQGKAPLTTPWVTPKGLSYYPLEMAIATGNPMVLEVLLENDREGQLNLQQSVQGIGTLLHLTIRVNQAPMLEYLLSKHFDKVSSLLYHSDPEGRTPMQLAAYLGDLYAIRVLHRYQVDLNFGTQQKGGTAVHYAAQGEQPDAIRLLDWLGADLLRTNDKGETPLILLKGRKTPAAKECKGLLITLPHMARSEKTEPPNYTHRPPYNLVIQGGGPKGIAYLGALEAMERLGTLNELKRLAGISAGAITAAFLAVGCGSKLLRDLLNRNFEEFLDTGGSLKTCLLGAAQAKSYREAIQTLLKEYWGGWSTLLHPIKRAQALKDKLIKLTGLASGETLREWIEGVIHQQTGIQHCTFGELQELAHQDPQKYKELHIFSIREGKEPHPEIIRFSHEDPLWKDLIISDAVRASLSIPGVFEPHTLHFKDATGVRHPREHHGKFLDAGLIRNFPIDAFDAEKYQEDPYFRGEKTNRRTLGLSLRDATPYREEEILNISSSTDLLKALMSTYYNAEQILLEETGLYRDRTIVLPIQGIGLLDFNVKEDIKQLNINAGREKTDSFFSTDSTEKHALKYVEKTSPLELLSGTSVPYRYAVFYAFQKQELISQTYQKAQEIAEQLRAKYTSNPYISLLIPRIRKEIPIKKLYTRLAIIGEAEKEKKRKEVEKAHQGQNLFGYEIIPTYESIFEPKEVIELENIFNHGSFKTKTKTKTKKPVLIQGPAGIGKTTLCHHIAYRWARGKLFQEFDYLFWLPLRNLSEKRYSTSATLVDYLARECSIDSQLIPTLIKDEQLREKTLILLDGYDELSPDAEHPYGGLYPILKELKEFPHLLATTRPQPVDLGPKAVCRLEILGFDAKGVEEYIGRFFSEAEESRAQEMRRFLQEPLIRSLSRIPINLEIFCSLAAVGKLPSDNPTMTSLYIQLTDWLFKRFRLYRSSTLKKPSQVIQESNPRNAKEVNPLARALEKIAWKAMEQNTLYLPEPQITEIFRNIDSEIEIGDMQRIGPLRIEEEEGVFIHLTFQEFFAAAYLAHLYEDENDPAAAKKELEKIKFKPRYQLVLSMTAGYLSHLSKKKFLQAFFDDLFSEPIDLAISYGLRLQARCFEECRKPEEIAQYESFIEKIIRYLREQPNGRLKADLLTGNSRLLSHEKIARFFIDHLLDETQQMNLLEILTQLAQRGQMIPNSILSSLISNAISEPRKNYVAHLKASQALQEVARSGQFLAKEELTALISVLTNPKADFDAKDFAAKALGEVAKSDQPLAQEVLKALISILTNPKADFDAKGFAAEALGAVAQSGQILAKEVLTALISLVTDPKADSPAQNRVALALGRVAESNQPLPKEMLEALISVLTSPKICSFAKNFPAEALGAVAQSSQFLAKEAQTLLINLVTDPKVGSPARELAARTLGRVARSDQPLAQEILKALISLIADSKVDSFAQYVDSFAQYLDCLNLGAINLGEVAKNGHLLPKEVLTVLVSLITNPKTSYDTKSSAIGALGAVAQGVQPLAEEALTALISLVTHPQTDLLIQELAILTLGEVAKSSQPLGQEALAALICLVTNPQVDSSAQSDAAYALGKVAQSGQFLHQEELKALISIVANPRADSGAKSSAIEALGELAQSGHPLTQEALTALISLVTDPKAGFYTKRSAAAALGKVAGSDQPLAQEALTALICLVTNPQADSSAQSVAALALRQAAKNGYLLPKETLTSLISILTNPEMASYYVAFSHAAFSTLGEMAKRGQPFAEQAMTELINLATDPKAGFYTKVSAAETLGEVAESGQTLPEEAMTAVINLITDPKVASSAEDVAGNILGKMAESGQPLSEEALTALISSLSLTYPRLFYITISALKKIAERQSYRLSHQPSAYKLLAKLCYLTGQAFFFRKGRFYITKKQGKARLEIKEGIDSAKLYEELISDQSQK